MRKEVEEIYQRQKINENRKIPPRIGLSNTTSIIFF